MEPTVFLGGRVKLYAGDNRVALPLLAAGSVDSVVTDPPYHLTSIVKRFGASDAAPASEGVYRRSASGFMGKQWDGGDIAFRSEFWADVLRVLKPGGHLVAFGGTRTYHRLACAIEDAGFEIRDAIMWHYGSGFPKSHDVSKGIDRQLGFEPDFIANGSPVKRMIPGADQNKDGWEKTNGREYQPGESRPATDAARQWQGWGTALKPATEIIVLARKPLSEGTVAANVMTHGTGAINIDGCRIGAVGGTTKAASDVKSSTTSVGGYLNAEAGELNGKGRWPANLVHDGSEEVLAAFPDAPGQQRPARDDQRTQGDVYGAISRNGTREHIPRSDSGSAARFFYTAKADSSDRIGSRHPTVKPVDLMRWLCRLVTPPGGTILDPFSGTGTTGEAAYYEGFNAILMEREPEYIADLERRMKLVLAGPDERSRESIKARGADDDPGPLFALPSP